MRQTDTRSGRRHAGFSLLEMLVAISILGLTLGALYQATGGATRNLRTTERYAYGVELARSLLAANAVVPAGGVSRNGETAGGFRWQVRSKPITREDGPANVRLQDIEVVVGWRDGPRERSILLQSVVEGSGQ